MPFLNQTRQQFTELAAQTITPGQRLYFQLPPVGLLSRLFLWVKGTTTVTPGTGTAALSDRGAANFIKRVKLLANSGSAIYDVSGYGTHIINNILSFGTSPDKTLFDRSISAEVYGSGVNSGANDWRFCYQIPIAINQRDPIGMILLQNEATQLTLEVEFNDIKGANNLLAPIVVTGDATATFSGICGCNMEYFTVPRETADRPALNVVHQWLEQQDAITSTGENPKSMLRGNTYMRLAHYLTLGNALSSAVDKLKIVYNTSETPYIINEMTQLALQRSRYGMDLPKGTYVWDWYMSNGLVGLGTSRDFINSANVTQFESILDIDSSATVTAGQSYINTLTEQLIMIA
jgi:hypothetical protein